MKYAPFLVLALFAFGCVTPEASVDSGSTEDVAADVDASSDIDTGETFDANTDIDASADLDAGPSTR